MTGGRALLSAPVLPWALVGCAAPRMPVQVALNAWVGYALLHLATEMDYLSEREVRLQEFPSNTASMMALVNGQVPAAALTLDELLLVREGGATRAPCWCLTSRTVRTWSWPILRWPGSASCGGGASAWSPPHWGRWCWPSCWRRQG